jgi:hypothetical protein
LEKAIVVLFTWKFLTNDEARKHIRRIETHDMQLGRIIYLLQDIVDLREAIKSHLQKIAELQSETSDIAKLHSGSVVRQIEQSSQAQNCDAQTTGGFTLVISQRS